MKDYLQTKEREFLQMSAKEQDKEMEKAVKFCQERDLLPEPFRKQKGLNLKMHSLVRYWAEQKKQSNSNQSEKWVNLLYQREQDWDPILWLAIPEEKYLENRVAFEKLSLPVITEMEKAANSLPTLEEAIAKEKDPLAKENLEQQVKLLEGAGVVLKEVEDNLSPEEIKNLEPMTADYLEKTLLKIKLGRPQEEM